MRNRTLPRRSRHLSTADFFATLKNATVLSEDQFKAAMVQLRKDMEQKQEELGEKNKTDGPKFLEENKKKPGVKMSPRKNAPDCSCN
jgi:FKBP-type peptidyl-prolyl cis-trans isomerase